ncbi:GNAT family N-acetyltransferase [Chloroflexota bacterium]
MIQEIGPGDNGFENGAYTIPFGAFPDYLKRLEDRASGKGLKPEHVPMTTYWLMINDRPAGISKLRHYLNENLLKHGGHIGYCIRPSEQGKGYGNIILKLTCIEARKMGIDELLLTCNEDNTASRRVIEKNGGILERLDEQGCYYWISLKA